MNCLGMFAKYWEPGRVKTRLAATIGAEAAATIYAEFIRSLLVRLSEVGERRWLCFTPDGRRAEFESLAGSLWHAVPQAVGDLGQRMSAYFDEAFTASADRVVLIGSDSPTLPHAHVTRAFSALREHDVVLGPTLDGGYYLVGARGHTPPIFEDISWSTSEVWKQTVERLERSGLSYEELPSWYDVDERADLFRLRDELLRSDSDEPWRRTLLAVVQRVLE